MKKSKIKLDKLIPNYSSSRMVTILVLLGLFYSCTTYMEVVKKESIPNENLGYVFGVFEVFGEYNNNNIAITITNVNTLDEYNFRLQEGHGGVYASEVPPGEYQFTPKAIYDFELSITQRSPIEFVSLHPELERKFKVEPGQAVYLGNFFGTQARYGNYMVMKLETYKSDFEIDSIRFILNNPNFNGFKLAQAYKLEGKNK